MNSALTSALKKYQHTFHNVVPFNHAKDKLLHLNFTSTNTELTDAIISDEHLFSNYIKQKINKTNALYGIGGYAESRFIYGKSKVFDAAKPGEEPRRLHLGIDIWANAGTPVYAFNGGMIHSFGYNNAAGDYGATLILLHQLNSVSFYSLYGHISLKDINNIHAGEYVSRGQQIAHVGSYTENGNWPPHLHFQLIHNMEMKKGDYPGVCAYSEKDKYLNNCPNPDLVLNMMQYAVND